MNTQSTLQMSMEAVLQRIDAMTRELLDLRRLIAAQLAPRAESQEPDLVTRLVGCLGQGSWEEYEDDIEWERFSL